MNPPNLCVDFWDVGYGDASVVRLGPDRAILIDAGPENSPLPFWLYWNHIRVDLAVFTHNDDDHFGGFIKLLELCGKEVGPYALVMDRPFSELRRAWHELLVMRERGQIHDPIALTPRREEPQDLLAEAKVTAHLYADALQLLAIYPSQLDHASSTGTSSNDHSALIVLFFHGIPRVAWPGDLPLETCQRELDRRGIRPAFLVGPHHGAPAGVKDRKPKEVQALAKAVGHTQSWISVAWHKGRKHPLPQYLRPVSRAGIEIRCSQLTRRCDPKPSRFGQGLFPSHDWLGLHRPPKSTSCMGPMRVTFDETGHHVEFEEVHRKLRTQIQRPLCVPKVKL